MWLCSAILAASTTVCHGQRPDPDPGLLAQMAPVIQQHHGKVALFARELRSGSTVGVDEDKPLQTASVIKLALLYEIMEQVRAGTAHWDEPIVLQPKYAVGGSGMLHFFDAPLKLTLKDVTTMMIIVSDNTATNLLIDRFTVDAVNKRMEGLGLPNTHLYKRVFLPPVGKMPDDQPKFGLGKTTPREMATLMETIGACRLRPNPAFSSGSRGSSAEPLLGPDDADITVCTVALEMLKSQFYRETIPRYLPGGGEGAVASKTGSLDAVRNDVAIISGKSGPMVLAIFTYENADHGWTVDNEGEMTIARLAKIIVNAWSPAGLDSKALVAGLGLPGIK